MRASLRMVRCAAAQAQVLPSHAAAAAAACASSARGLHVSAAARQLPGTADELPAGEGGVEDEGGAPGGEGRRPGGGKAERMGRPFLDPRAPRRVEEIRAAPEHQEWGGMIDILEHAAYSNGQREEDPDGFFFDFSVPEYDSENDGDPFANGYLTEDEMEWPEDYKPEPPVPRRVCEQIHFLHTVRKYSIQRLCTKYRLGSERVCAIILLARREPEMKASGRFNIQADQLLQNLYYGAAQKRSSENFAPDFDQGVNYNVMRDDQMPDDVYPTTRVVGNVLRGGHTLPRIPVPPRGERPMKSKFLFRDISGSARNKPVTRPYLVSDWQGRRRRATNTEALYRSWEMRYWSLGAEKDPATRFPFTAEEKDKPMGFSLPGPTY